MNQLRRNVEKVQKLLSDTHKKSTYAPFTLLRFCTKTENNIRFREIVHTAPHKNAQKRRFSINALQSGYSQKRRLLKTQWISVNAQKRIKTKTLQQQKQNTSQFSRQIQR